MGRAIGVALGRAGYAVCVNYVHETGLADATARDCGRESLAFRADVSSPTEVGMMMAELADKWGRLDVIVNNAGVTCDALISRQSLAGWDIVMDTNLRGATNIIRASAPLMTQGGHIVNISSRSGMRGAAGQSAYAASKAALIGLTLAAARELAPVRVNALLPGYMPTELGVAAPEALKRAKAESVLGRLSDPAEAASFIVWLTSTGGISGQVFTLDSRP